VKIDLAFVPAGRVIDPAPRVEGGPSTHPLLPGQVYLDVGGHLCERILDHHFSMDQYLSATEACVREFDAFIEKPLKGYVGPITLITHCEPDLDGAMAIFYTKMRLEGQSQEGQGRLWDRVVEMVSANDQGYRTGTPEASFPILFRALIQAHSAEYSAAPDAFLERRAFPLIRKFLDHDADPAALWHGMKGFEEKKLQMIIERAGADYQEDLRQGTIFQAFVPVMDLADDAAWQRARGGAPDPKVSQELPKAVPARARGQWSVVDGIVLNEPRSTLFKELLRADQAHAPLGQGFCLSLVHLDKGGAGQHVISVDPARGVTLMGLGGLLEATEKAAEAEQGRTRKDRDGKTRARQPELPGRHGYGLDDPWYDGRGHAFTIIDNPNSGSVLTSDEVNEVVWAYGNPGLHTQVLNARATFFLQISCDQSTDRFAFRRTCRGWRSVESPMASLEGLLPSVARALVPLAMAPPGVQDLEDCAIHFDREQKPFEEHAFLQGARERLILFPEKIGVLRIEIDLGGLTVFDLGTRLAQARKDLHSMLRTDPVHLALELGLTGAFQLAKDGDIHHFFQLQFADTGFALDSIQLGLKACLYQLARGVSPEFRVLPHSRILKRLERVSRVDGREEVWILPNGCMSLEVVSRAPALDEGRALLMSLAHFQKEYFVRIATSAANATDNISRGGLVRRKGLRELATLHRDLVEFMSRWRLDEVSPDPWNQSVYQGSLKALRIHELGLAARDRVSQMAELIMAEREREQNRFLGFITLVFLPISLVAGLFSGIQMQAPSPGSMLFPFTTWGNSFQQAFGSYANWVAFGCYVMGAVTIAVLLWSTVLFRRKRGRHRARSSRKGRKA